MPDVIAEECTSILKVLEPQDNEKGEDPLKVDYTSKQLEDLCSKYQKMEDLRSKYQPLVLEASSFMVIKENGAPTLSRPHA